MSNNSTYNPKAMNTYHVTEAPILPKYRKKTSFKRLRSRIMKEIRKKKFLGDISVNDEEYGILVQYVREILSSEFFETRLQYSDICLTVCIVQIGIRYYDGNFWRHTAQELQAPNLSKLSKMRTRLSECVLNTLQKYQKVTTNDSEFVQNVLMHGYISNHYADQYFDFLYAFYRLDLGRNITLLDSDCMRSLVESIADSSSGRTYMIREQVKDAILHNPRGCKARLRKHLRLIDSFFWDENFQLHTNNRIYNLLQKWVDKNNHFEAERLEIGIRRRGKKAFSKPYLFADFKHTVFSIRIPAQLLPRDSQNNLFWKITVSNSVEYIRAQIVETVTAYRTEPDEYLINSYDLFSQISIALVCQDGSSVRSFTIPAGNVRFFDDEGHGEKPANLSAGVYFAYTTSQTDLVSAAIVDHVEVENLNHWYIDFQDGDIIRLPDGNVVFVGKKITEGLLKRGKISDVKGFLSDNSGALDVYRRLPTLTLRAPLAKSEGILLQINGKRYRLDNKNTIPFSFDDGTTDVGYYIELENITARRDGIYDIYLDIPNGSKKWYSFLLVQEMNIEFDGAPYIFEPRGSLNISCDSKILPITPGCKKTDNDQFDFEISSDTMSLQFQMVTSGTEFVLEIKVPALFWRYDDGIWKSEQPEYLWHKDLPAKIEIVAPCEKATFRIDELDNDESNIEQKPIVGETQVDHPGFIFDTTRLKTYLSSDQMLRTLYLDMDQLTKRFVQIVTHSAVMQCVAIAHYDERSIEVRTSIIGGADYYADISFGGKILAEKVPLMDRMCHVEIPEGLRSGEYEIELFEGSSDDFGFGDDYESLVVYTQTLVNPYDMRGRNIELVQIHRESGRRSSLLMRYIATDLQYMEGRDQSFYSAKMIVYEKDLPIASYPAVIEFYNYDTLDRVRLYFEDEGEDITFLYDAVRRIIVKEEDTGIGRSEQYRRFEMLYEEDVFEICFVKEDIIISQELPERIPTWTSQGRNTNVMNGMRWRQTLPLKK